MIIYINLILKENFLNKSKFKNILACFLIIFFTLFYNAVLAGNSVNLIKIGDSPIYKFVKDISSSIIETKIGNKTFAKTTYNSNYGLLKQIKYGNEQIINYYYDENGKLIKKSFSNENGKKLGEITYNYDNKGRLFKAYDSLNDLTTSFEYDLSGRIEHIQRNDGFMNDLTYDNFRNLVSKSVLNFFGTQQILVNTFGKFNMLLSSQIQTNNNIIFSEYCYDNTTRIKNLDVLTSSKLSGIRHEFFYDHIRKNRTTKLVSGIEIKKKTGNDWTSLDKKFNYTYDVIGNIIEIKDINNSVIASYQYDNLNQLIRENNCQIGKTIIYKYNAGGNLIEKKIYSYTTDTYLNNITPENTITYTYRDSNWADKLTSYNGQDIVYDAVGNPLEYKGWKFDWSRGRRLSKALNLSYGINVSYEYDENGTRTQKIVNGIQTNFITSGIKILAQKTDNSTIIWQIDGNGNTVGFNYNGTSYFYVKNAQEDIIGIANASGNMVANYTYDSWGKLISIKDENDADRTNDVDFIGYINPLRYKGYYYDSETCLYYLNTRYYDPEIGRFVNADETFDGGYNLFEYCFNNPVNLHDPDGRAPKGPGYLHDGFATMDEAAIDWAYFYHPRAINEGVEYGSNIFINNGRYYYRNAIIGGPTYVLIPDEAGSKGYVHSHHNSSEPRANIFAIAGDVDVSESRNIIGYVVTPAGDIQRYTPLGNWGRNNGGIANLGTLTWIYYSCWLKGSNGSKWFWKKNAFDRRLDQLRINHGSIIGQQEYNNLWYLYVPE